MKYKKFGPEIWGKIDKSIADAKNSAQGQLYAAFDADGTLWDTDLGESFFQFQIKENLIPNLPVNPWQHYRQMKESGDPRPAYLWLAQINKGFSINQVRDWAQTSVRKNSQLPIFDDQKKLIEKLLAAETQIYIVTASVKWAVEPGASLVGLGPENVIGVQTKILNNVITDIQEGEMTYKEGKVKALLQKTNGIKPFLCSGNSTGDVHLLENSTRLSIAVGAAQKNSELYSTEESLRKIAIEKNWLVHQF